ncbi:MAG: BON domain-containing protein [Candidatus Omnitrophica bacterium]|nr:BON domain-containing protein [Candidatus Omnitrophota bacterium]
MNLNYLKIMVAVTAAVLFTSVYAIASEMDQRIEASAKDSYVFKTYLKDDSINIMSMDGVVMLTGSVKEDSHKALAQETVASLPGVKSVDNKLEFKGELPNESSDIWIGMQVKYSLLYNRNVSGLNTKVSVTDGIVTLKGEANSQAQKDLTSEYAKDIKNVKDVKNEMTIAATPKEVKEGKETMGEKIDDASITAQVKIAFLTHHSTSAFKTGVETKDGVVTLSGVASSGAGKDMATKVASDVKGVTSVVNNMTVDESLLKK